MKKFKYSTPTRVSDLDFESLYDEISFDLDNRIEKLHNRRWRKIREELA